MRNVIKAGLIALVLTTALVTSANAGPLEDGQAAYGRQDYATALRLWRPLADQGDAAAQFALGAMYGKGQGVTRDDAQAVKWYRLAANQGDAAAQISLGAMYGKGQGVAQDYVQAHKWLNLAADQGDAYAQTNLGAMYGKGQGVAQDYVQAHKWLNLAAAQGDKEAVKNRDIIAARMTPSQIAEAQKLAREWKPK